MNWLLIAMGIVLVWRIAEGFHRGMVKELISCVSLIVLCLAVLLLGTALGRYFERDIPSMIAAVILLLVLCLAHRLLNLVFFSAKLIAKLPIIHFMNKLAGALLGAVETVFILWTIFSLILTFGLGIMGKQITQYAADSEILRTLYRYNYLQHWVEVLTQKFDILKTGI